MQSLSTAHIDIISEPSHTLLRCSGMWTLSHLNTIAYRLETFQPKSSVIWDVSQVDEIDSAGIALWHLYHRAFEKEGITSELIGINENHSKLYSLLYSGKDKIIFHPTRPSWLYSLGEGAHKNLKGIAQLISFLGEAFVLLFYTLLHPSKIRYRSIVAHIFTTGAAALTTCESRPESSFRLPRTRNLMHLVVLIVEDECHELIVGR